LTVVHRSLDIPLQTAAEIFKHGGASRQDNVGIQSTTRIDGTRLDRLVDHAGQRSEKVGGKDFGIKKHFRRQKALVPNVNIMLLSRYRVLEFVLFNVLQKE
jgi:hypothetical protein